MKRTSQLICAVLALGLPHLATAGFEAPDAQKPGSAESVYKPRSWDLSARVFYGNDGNTALAPDVTGYRGAKDSNSYGAQLKGVYRVLQSREWNAGLTGSADVAVGE